MTVAPSRMARVGHAPATVRVVEHDQVARANQPQRRLVVVIVASVAQGCGFAGGPGGG
jgi:hypothetical protein